MSWRGEAAAATTPRPIRPAIPDIFLKETQQVSGQQIVEETFFPILTSSSPILRGLEDGLPQLRGYNGSTAKAAAQTVLVSTRDDPVLAQWQYGLGRAVAWTSDAQGRWAANWVAWDGFNQFFSQLVSWTFPGEESGGMEAEFITEGDQVRLQLRSVESDGTPRNFFDTVAGITNPSLDVNEVRLDQVAPGVYEAPLGQLTPGAYALRFVQTKPGETPLARTVMLIAPTPAEYRLLGTNERLLAALRGATGGEALDGWRDRVGARPGHDHGRHGHAALAAAAGTAPVAARRRRPARVDRSLRPRPGACLERRSLAVVARPGASHRTGGRDACRNPTCRRRSDACSVADADTAARAHSSRPARLHAALRPRRRGTCA